MPEKDIARFEQMYDEYYERVASELSNGVKESHWMWFIFPQIQGLGHSSTAKYYAIKDKEEAIAYWNDPVLSSHLLEISRELLKLNSPIDWIIGYPDNLKLRSCMTLFYLVSNENIFKEVLDKFYAGEMDEVTKQILA